MNRKHLLLGILLALLAAIAAGVWITADGDVERDSYAAVSDGVPPASMASLESEHDSSLGGRSVVSASAPEAPSVVVEESPLPKIEHRWDSIGGLCTPDMYPEVADLIASPLFNPRAKQLDEARLSELTRLREALRARLEESRQTAMHRMSEAVTQMIEFGETLPEGAQIGIPADGSMVFSRANRDGVQSRVHLRPGRFAYVDTACARARNEALDGERQLQMWFRSLQ
jgi:hypothetical protein